MGLIVSFIVGVVTGIAAMLVVVVMFGDSHKDD